VVLPAVDALEVFEGETRPGYSIELLPVLLPLAGTRAVKPRGEARKMTALQDVDCADVEIRPELESRSLSNEIAYVRKTTANTSSHCTTPNIVR
jgi:hypothetical protein